jgi:multidrug resistance efflux pump
VDRCRRHGRRHSRRFVEAAPPAGAVTVVAAPAPIPAGIATVARQDVPVYLTGLGTVQAFNTVTVKTRVDGELQKVAFTEGQDVKAGDLLYTTPIYLYLERLNAWLGRRRSGGATASAHGAALSPPAEA